MEILVQLIILWSTPSLCYPTNNAVFSTKVSSRVYTPPPSRCSVLACNIAVAVVVAPIATSVDALTPPPPRVVWSSPLSVFNHVLSESAPSQSKKVKQKGSQTGRFTMIGHVPDNEFAWFSREDYLNSKVVYDEATIGKTLRSHHTCWTYWFDRSNKIELDDDEGPTLRSALQDVDDWVVDHDLVEGKYTDNRKLDRYLIEQLWVSYEKHASYCLWMSTTRRTCSMGLVLKWTRFKGWSEYQFQVGPVIVYNSPSSSPTATI